LTEERVADLIGEAAKLQQRATYAGELGQRTERLFVAAFYEALRSGSADEILDSLRPAFGTAAEAIAAARHVILTEQPAEQFLADASRTAVTAWQGLDGHLDTDETIGRVCRSVRPESREVPTHPGGSPVSKTSRHARIC
jgi:hypothetical protein